MEKIDSIPLFVKRMHNPDSLQFKSSIPLSYMSFSDVADALINIYFTIYFIC